MVRLLELFGGIGACSKAFERLGLEFTIADYVEINKFSVKSFNAVHGTTFKPQDITEWDKDIPVDVIMHGSPCQDFSKAGLQAGGDENSGTRSSLLYETVRIVAKLRPKVVIWENVRNVLSARHRKNFDRYIERMKDLGYKSYYDILNAKDYGIPQNRERVFTVSIRSDLDNGSFFFPRKKPLQTCLKDYIDDEVDDKFYISKEYAFSLLSSNFKQMRDLIMLPDGCLSTLLSIDSNNCQHCVCIGRLTGEKYKKRFDSNRRVYSVYGLASTLTTASGGGTEIKVLIDDLKIRKLTPKEYWRLMGFDDGDYEKAARVSSKTRLYEQAGNSIVVNVLEEIISRLTVALPELFGQSAKTAELVLKSEEMFQETLF